MSPSSTPTVPSVTIHGNGSWYRVTWRYWLGSELFERDEEAVGVASLRRVLRDFVRHPDAEKIVQDVLRRGQHRRKEPKTDNPLAFAAQARERARLREYSS